MYTISSALSCFLCLFVVRHATSDVVNQAKLHVGIYYESLCPDSVRFIGRQLAPEYKHFSDYAHFEFIPFGKSRSIRTEEDIDFECQHGEDECAGNAIQSCALNSLPDQDKQVEFVSCQMTFGSEPTGQTCAESVGLPWPVVTECYYSGLGTMLQLEAEKATKAIAHPNEMLKFVPTIVYNHAFDQVKQNRSLREFRQVLCEELEQVLGKAPATCRSL